MNNNGIKRAVKGIVGSQKFIAALALVAIYLFFAIASKSFRSVDTLVSIFDASYYIGCLAIGVTFVIITGGIDLSVGTVMMCAAIIGGVLYNLGMPMWLTLSAIIGIGTLFGLINGVLVARFKLPSFILVLVTTMVVGALVLVVSHV